MSSVLIKGKTMPKNCKTCGFAVCDDEYSPEYWCPIVRDSVDNYVNCRHKLCPLVEIPPHGRLIDASEMAIKFSCRDIDITTVKKLHEWLMEIPTVIESEEQEHEQ